jgi:hypothetical protein
MWILGGGTPCSHVWTIGSGLLTAAESARLCAEVGEWTPLASHAVDGYRKIQIQTASLGQRKIVVRELDSHSTRLNVDFAEI